MEYDILALKIIMSIKEANELIRSCQLILSLGALQEEDKRDYINKITLLKGLRDLNIDILKMQYGIELKNTL